MSNNLTTHFTDFITKDSFSNLISCAAIVGLITEVLKHFIGLKPMILVFFVSLIISTFKLILSENYSKENIILAIINVFPLALTAAGGYDLLTRII